ncbi:MAG: hypothetical protein AAF762_05280 [Pseudomonadota bacterium]
MFDAAPSDNDGQPDAIPGIVFSVTGAHPGPRLVVTGARSALDAAVEKLFELRGLVAMRGKLEVRAGDWSDASGYADAEFRLDDAPRNGHLHILGRMASLGMIAGRGVPARYIA